MSEYRKHFDDKVIDGVRCILWKTNTHDPATGRSISAVRRAKDITGSENMDTPVIDSRYVEGTKEWCNMILYTTHVDAWELALNEHYTQTPPPKKTSTKQLYYTIGGEDAFTVQFYTKKLMFQQIEYCRVNHLYTIIKNWHAISAIMQREASPDGGQENTKKTAPETAPAASDIAPETIHADSDITPETAPADSDIALKTASAASPHTAPEAAATVISDVAPEQDIDQSSHQIEENTEDELEVSVECNDATMLAAAELIEQSSSDTTCDTPVSKAAKEVQITLNASDNSVDAEDTGVQTDEKGTDIPIVSELLCFMQNKMETLATDALILLCCDFYSPDVVTAAKKLLYTTLKKTFVQRNGAKKAAKHLQDMIEVFQEMPVINPPRFVAQDLQNLPPTVTNTDSLHLMAEISTMKHQISSLVQSQKAILKMVDPGSRTPEESSTRETKSPDVSKSCLAPKVIPSEVPKVPQIIEAEAPPVTESEAPTVTKPEAPTVIESEAPTVTESEDNSSTDESDRSDGESNDTDTTDNEDKAEETVSDFLSHWIKVGRKKSDSGIKTYADKVKENPTNLRPQWVKTKTFTRSNAGQSTAKVHPLRSSKSKDNKQNKDSLIIGASKSTKLKAVRQVRQNGVTNQSRKCTGLFVSRLSPHTTPRQISNEVYSISGHRVTSEKIKTKYDYYSSYYIKCEKNIRESLLDCKLWPEGVLVKPFFS